ELDPAADDVVPGDDALVGHAKADRALGLVGLALGDELLGMPPRLVDAVELEGDGAVPVDPEPAQRVLDLLHRLGDLAARVRVLDPGQLLVGLLPGARA